MPCIPGHAHRFGVSASAGGGGRESEGVYDLTFLVLACTGPPEGGTPCPAFQAMLTGLESRLQPVGAVASLRVFTISRFWCLRAPDRLKAGLHTLHSRPCSQVWSLGFSRWGRPRV